MDRMQAIMCFSWIAVWNGHRYGNTFDLDLSKTAFEDLYQTISNIVKIIQKNKDESYIAIKNNPSDSEAGTFIFEDLKSYFEKSHTLGFGKDPVELLQHLANNEHAPGIVRDVLKAHLGIKECSLQYS